MIVKNELFYLSRFIQCVVGTKQEFENLSKQMTKHFGILLFQKGMLTVKTSQAYFMPAFYQFLKRQLIP